jgi:hypothetical protein
MYGLTERELAGGHAGPTFVDRLVADGPAALTTPAGATPDLREYVDRALRGGFPEIALGAVHDSRRRWLEGYVGHVVTRDAEVETAGRGRDPARLRRYLEALAINTAGTVTDATLYEAAQVDRRTALAYERLLQSLGIVDSVPAWTSNRLKRLVLAPKRYVTEPLLVGLLGIDQRAVLRDGDVLGRLLDTFVAAQLRAELSANESSARLYHLRDKAGRHEVDLVIEVGARRIIGIEIKATAAPGADDARHLTWLSDQLGEDFVAGVVFHTGPRSLALGDRIVAAPIATLWS